MNILIVTAHPCPTGLTHGIASTYAEAKRTKGDDVRVVDLYSKDFEVPCLNFTNIREFPISPVQQQFHDQIKWANEIVVVHPIWWGLPPSIMKSWVELTFWPRVTYSYLPNGSVNKLLKGKTAKIFATAGGASWYYHFIILPLKSFWEICVFGFSGVSIAELQICGKMDILKGEARTKHIQKFLEKIKKSA